MIPKPTGRLCMPLISQISRSVFKYLEWVLVPLLLTYMQVLHLIFLCHCIDVKTCLVLNNNFVVVCYNVRYCSLHLVIMPTVPLSSYYLTVYFIPYCLQCLQWDREQGFGPAFVVLLLHSIQTAAGRLNLTRLQLMTANTDAIYFNCFLSQAQHGESNASFQISTSCI